MQLTNFECTHLRSDLAHEPIHMIGLSVPLSILGRMLGEGTLGNTITVVSLVPSFVRVLVGVVICVSMLMACLSVGYIQHNTGLDFAKMARAVIAGYASLLTPLRNSDLYMHQQVLLFLRLALWLLLLLLWTWLLP